MKKIILPLLAIVVLLLLIAWMAGLFVEKIEPGSNTAVQPHSGEPVVVKVIHDGIEGRVRRDLYILGLLAELMEKHSPLLRQYQPVATAKQFSRTLMGEMDFGHERRNLDEFARNFSDDPTVVFKVQD